MLQQYQIVLKDSKWLISIIRRLLYKRRAGGFRPARVLSEQHMTTHGNSGLT